MTERQHELWCRVADHSRRRRWYVPADRVEAQMLSALFSRGFFQRRRSDGAYRLFMLWPRPYRWPSWLRGEELTPHYWWPPWWPANASERRRSEEIAMTNDLTSEEHDLIRRSRESARLELADLEALVAVLPRAKSALERHQLERMIERRGGPPTHTCRCGQPVTPASGDLRECMACYERGYGK